MKTKIRLFYDINKCESFVNYFCSCKKILKKDITPVVVKEEILYFVVLEYF